MHGLTVAVASVIVVCVGRVVHDYRLGFFHSVGCEVVAEGEEAFVTSDVGALGDNVGGIESEVVFIGSLDYLVWYNGRSTPYCSLDGV